MARVTGIGGIFFKAKDPKSLSAWYEQHLGMKLESWGGAILKWPEDTANDRGLTVWNAAAADTKWFAPSESSFMVNYRVDDLTELLANLASAGITPLKGPDLEPNGKFAWVLDPEGNKAELWEPKRWEEKE